MGKNAVTRDVTSQSIICNKTLHEILDNRQICGCDLCMQRISVNKTVTKENELCAKTWTLIREAILHENSEKRQEILHSLSCQVQHVLALLFQPISICIEEYIANKKSRLVKLICLGYGNPLSALGIASELLDMYEKFMDIVADISISVKIELMPWVKWRESWTSWCKGIFRNFICSESLLHQALPEILLQLQKGSTCENHLHDFGLVHQAFSQFCDDLMQAPVENRPLLQLINDCLKDSPTEVNKFKKFCKAPPLHLNIVCKSTDQSGPISDLCPPYVPYIIRDTPIKCNTITSTHGIGLPGLVAPASCNSVGNNGSIFSDVPSFRFPAPDAQSFEYLVRTGTLDRDFATFWKHSSENIRPPSISSDDSPISLSSDEEVQVFTKPSDFATKNFPRMFPEDDALRQQYANGSRLFGAYSHSEISKFYAKYGEPAMNYQDGTQISQLESSGNYSFTSGNCTIKSENYTVVSESYTNSSEIVPEPLKSQIVGMPQMATNAMFRVNESNIIPCPDPFSSPFSHQFTGFSLGPAPFTVPVLQPQDAVDSSIHASILPCPTVKLPFPTEPSSSAGDQFSIYEPQAMTMGLSISDGEVNFAATSKNVAIPPTVRSNSVHNAPQIVTTTSVQQRKKLVAHGRLGRQNAQQLPKAEEQKFKTQLPTKSVEEASLAAEPTKLKFPFETCNKMENAGSAEIYSDLQEQQCASSSKLKATGELIKPVIETDESVLTSDHSALVVHSTLESVQFVEDGAEPDIPTETEDNGSRNCQNSKNPHDHGIGETCDQGLNTSHGSQCDYTSHPKGNGKVEPKTCSQRKECSSSSNCNEVSSATGGGTTKYCDCCYCEFFGSGSPTVAPMSKNYPEMRERLRQKLKKNKSCKKDSSHGNKISDCEQQALKSESHQQNDRSLDEIISFIEGGGIESPYLPKKTQKKSRNKTSKENERKKTETQSSPTPKIENLSLEIAQNNSDSHNDKKAESMQMVEKKSALRDDATGNLSNKHNQTAAKLVNQTAAKLVTPAVRNVGKVSKPNGSPETSFRITAQVHNEAAKKQQSRKTSDAVGKNGSSATATLPRDVAKFNHKYDLSAGCTSIGITVDESTIKIVRQSSSSRDSSSVDTVFLPTGNQEATEMDDVEKEIDRFKRFCLDSSKIQKKKIVVNWKDSSFKNKPKNQF